MPATACMRCRDAELQYAACSMQLQYAAQHIRRVVHRRLIEDYNVYNIDTRPLRDISESASTTKPTSLDPTRNKLTIP